MWNLAARLVRRSTEQLFRRIEVDEAWLVAVRDAAARGPLVYVLRNVSAADYLALQHLSERYELPPIGYVNELPRFIAPGGGGSAPERLLAALARGDAAALFVKRAPDRLGIRPRDGSEGDELLAALIARQRARRERAIMLVPHAFVWSTHSEKQESSLTDWLFGPVDFPGELRMSAQVLLNHRHARVRAGEPLSLQSFLAEQAPEANAAGRAHDAAAEGDGARVLEGSLPRPDAERVLVRRLKYVLLRRVERERRAIVGPARKLRDRLREEVLHSGRLQAVIAELGGPGTRERDTLTHKARAMLRELETAPDPQTQRGLEPLVARLLTRVYSGVDVDRAGIEALRGAMRRGSVVLLPSHKSHIDYIALSYVLRQNGIQLPVIAAGDNLSFFPVGPILRRAGAFFIRRSFGSDRLYVAVVDAYVRRLLRDGHTLEFFLEGGRSRTGKLLPPMLGLLNLVVTAALGLEGRPITFVPVSVSYERLMEESAFARELAGHEKPPEDAASLLRMGGVLFDRWGRINIQFGSGIELGALTHELGLAASPRPLPPAKRRTIVKTLAHRVMSEINRVTAVTPGALVAVLLLSHGGRGIAYQDLAARARRLVALFVAHGARIAPSLCRAPGEPLREAALREALALYVRGGLVVQHVPGETLGAEEQKRVPLYSGSDVIFTVPEAKRLRLDFAKNGIVHWLTDRAFVAVALGAAATPGATGTSYAALRATVQSLVRLFRYEFAFRADKGFEALLDEVLADMVAAGELVRTGELVARSADAHARADLGFYAAVVQNFLEAYRVAARGLRVLARGPLAQKELAQRALQAGERMFLRGEIERAEALSRPMIENAFAAFVDQGYLTRKGHDLALAESFASVDAVRTIEARIAALLAGPRARD